MAKTKDEPTEQREQSQTACRLSYAESRRRKADRPKATQRPLSQTDLSYPDNFPIKREQTKARFQYAEREESQRS